MGELRLMTHAYTLLPNALMPFFQGHPIFITRTTAAVIIRLIMVIGNNIFHPKSINWSYLGLGNEALNNIKSMMNTNVFNINHTAGGRKSGPSHPPKYKATVRLEIRTIPTYSPTKNIPNFIPEYSE